MVVDPAVGGAQLCKVLMDGTSRLNIIYTNTLEAMGILMSRLSKSSMQFHGVILGKKAKSLGKLPSTSYSAKIVTSGRND